MGDSSAADRHDRVIRRGLALIPTTAVHHACAGNYRWQTFNGCATNPASCPPLTPRGRMMRLDGAWPLHIRHRSSPLRRAMTNRCLLRSELPLTTEAASHPTRTRSPLTASNQIRHKQFGNQSYRQLDCDRRNLEKRNRVVHESWPMNRPE